MSGKTGRDVEGSNTPLRVLIVEDQPDDAELVLRELRRGGFAPCHERVDTAEALIAALAREPWDVVVADYSMPHFNGTEALAILRERGYDTPFIFVSGTMGEDAAVEAMRGGAQDFVVKGNIKRLVPAIERELREISDRRARARAEEGLRKLSRSVEHSANLVIITDTSGVIEYVNPKVSEATGYAAEELVGQKPSFWRSGETGDAEYAALWQTILAGKDWRGEFVNRKKDGGTIVVSAVISPIKDESGRITHFIGIQDDITQRKDLEDQLRHAQRMDALGQLTGGMAHDFNNLLTVIIGSLDQLEEQLADRPAAKRAAERAMSAGMRGAELTRNLLAFARRQPLAVKAFDLNQLVATTAELLRRTLGEQIEIRLALAKDLAPAFADPAQVESALTNLAINGRDAMPAGGRLTIETANQRLDAGYAAENVDVVPGDYIMLAVSDTGTGIPPDILGRVFEPFFTTKEHGRGTGLGLAMIYGFAKQSKGHVKIYSEVGHGTTVRLYLPRADAAPAPADTSADTGAMPRGDAAILLVEDNAQVRDVATEALKSLGYKVHEAEDGASALRILHGGEPIALLLTDIVMPGGINGFELAREARRLRPQLRFLLTSGFTDAALERSRPGDPPMPRLNKPYRRAELARAVRDALK